jgi:predicted acetyltransferase
VRWDAIRPGFFIGLADPQIELMTVAVRDARGVATDRAWIEGIYREYLDDLSAPHTGLFPALGEIGHGAADHFVRWFADRKVHVLTILRGDRPAGFAVVAPGEAAGAVPRPDYRMAEFFVSRQARRGGVGAAAAPLIFDRFAGRWEILEHQSNRAAVGFWRRVVAEYTHGKFEERVINGEVRQRFSTGPARRPA